mmetsp:Transcript_10256/g.31836  ORF Transcript_10256/g.31836 Transcript_10256/m.31836 type:complete len:339 (+) Transcript_10256:1254-2270(+)
MEPTLEAVAVHLGPDVVRPIVNVARLVAKGAAEQREAVRPFPAPAVPRLKQLTGIVVPGEAGLAAALPALRDLHIASTELLLCGRRGRAAHGVRVRGAAMLATWTVGPLEKTVLEPAEHLPHERHLVSLCQASFTSGSIQGTHRHIIECLALQGAVLVLPHVLKASYLALQPRWSVAQLCLEHGEVLLFHELDCRCGRGRLLDLKRVTGREVSEHDDGGRAVRHGRGVVRCRQQIGTQGNVVVVGSRLQTHKARSHRRREERPHGRLHEGLAAVEVPAAVHGGPGAGLCLCAGDPEPRDPLRAISARSQHHAGNAPDLPGVQLVPRHLVLFLGTPGLR